MNSKSHIFVFCFLFLCRLSYSQINTFSPYSRYGLGELNPTTFGHNYGMGGAYIALKPDSVMPIFINAGNPAAYALIKLTSLEVGGSGIYSKFSTNTTNLTKYTTNFAYGALGFPVKRNGGACFGIMPYTNVGYNLQSQTTDPNIGTVDYLYSGSGGLNKAFIGYGVMPFNKRLSTFRRRNLYVPDSVKKLRGFAYKVASSFNKLLSDFSAGFNVNYIFGSLDNTTQVTYPNSVLYNNTFRDRNLTMGNFTGNFGLQTALTIDSARAKRKKDKLSLKTRADMDSIRSSGLYTGEVLKHKLDSMEARLKVRRRSLSEKVKITFGYFMTLNNSMAARYNTTIYNYILDATGNTVIRDTVLYTQNQKSAIRLPLEEGFGIGFKKGERINAVADFAITNWQGFNYLGSGSDDLKTNYRIAAGVNFVPEKYATGSNSFFKRVNYRVGLSYQSGFIQLANTLISNYEFTMGVGLPVGLGRMSSMINLSVQLGQLGTKSNDLVKENYLRFTFGFTFSDRWFQKFKYD